MKSHLFALLALVATLAAGTASAQLYVIANPATKVSPEEVREIFLGDKQFAGATKLVPVDNGPSQDAFLGKVLKMDSTKYNTVWTKKSFREGLNPPAVKSGDAEVADFVRKTPGAVGYTATTPSGVTVVQKY